MKNRDTDFEDRKINLEAAEWVAKKNRGLSAEEQDDFFDWMAEDPRHSEYYGQHLRTWHRLDLLAQWKPEHSEEANPGLLKRNPRFNPYVAWGAIAACLVVGFFAFNKSSLFIPASNDSYIENLVAQDYEKYDLPDGSLVEMKEGAALKVDYTKNERRIELVSSEAHFDVEKNPDKPFVVSAKGFEFKAVGTAFSVKILEDEVELLVTEGVVEMSRVTEFDENLGNSSEFIPYKQEVFAEEISIGSIDQPAPFEVKKADSEAIDKFLAWKPRSLSFDKVPLSEVIAAFNARNVVQIEISDAELNDTIVFASFHTPSIPKLLGLLENTLDVHAEYVSDDRIVLSK